MGKSQTNAISVTLRPLGQTTWGHIWKRTVEKSQANATNVAMPPLLQVIWGNIWKHTVEKSWTNASNVTFAALIQVLWGHIWKYTVETSRTNATNVTMHPHRQAFLRDIWKCTALKSKNCKQCDCLFLGRHFLADIWNTRRKLYSLLAHSLRRHLKSHKDQTVMKHPLKLNCESVFNANIFLNYHFRQYFKITFTSLSL